MVGIESYLFENGVGSALGAASELATARPRASGPLRVGYFSGTTTHDDDWRHIETAVVEVLAGHPDAELWLGGHLQPTDAVLTRLGARVKRLPFTAWDQLPELLRDLDVNLAPLQPGSRFNDAKSAIKWLEAALVGTPTIASPSAPFVDAIEAGRTGWLAADPAEWVAALSHALTDEPDRRAVGERAKRAALLRWSPPLQADRYLGILQAVRDHAGPPRQPSLTWSPVANDEPWLPQPTPLAPYPPDGQAVPAPPPPPPPTVVEHAQAKVDLVRERLRDEGVASTVQAIARWARRRVSRDQPGG